MDTSTTTFCRFSPLKTPDIRQKYKNKFNSPRKDVSDTDSAVSMVTRDVRKIAKSVSDKLKKNSEQSMMSSDDDIFISQSKNAFRQDKKKSKRQVSGSDSGSTNHANNSNTVTDSEPEESSTSSVDVSPKKRRKLEANGSSPKKNAKKNTPVKLSEKSAIKSPGKSSKNRIDHELSDSDSDSVSLLTQKPQKKKTGSVSSVISSSDVSEVGQEPLGEIAQSPKTTVTRKDSSSSVSDVSSLDSSLDSDDGDKTKEVKKPGKNIKLNTLQQNDMSEDSDFDISKSKNKAKSTPSKIDTSAAGRNNSKFSEYKVPNGFEVDTSQKYLSKADLQGKQLWLITAPDDFDISSLHKKEIKMSGTSVVSAEVEMSEKQYEVVTTPFTSQMSSYNSLELETSGKEKLMIGSEIHGQIQIMDWIPAMPPVELVRPSPTKHRVPDNLKPTFKPFGCDSPSRDIDDEIVSSVHKSEKHKKKKKKKDKKR